MCNKNIFLISQPKHMLWVLKRTVSVRHTKGMLKMMGKKIFQNCTLNIFVYLNLWLDLIMSACAFIRGIMYQILVCWLKYMSAIIHYWNQRTLCYELWDKTNSSTMTNVLKFRTLFLSLFSNKMLVDKAGIHKMLVKIWAVIWDFQQCGMCDQQSLRSACAYTQSDQILR